jgi:predicted permease
MKQLREWLRRLRDTVRPVRQDADIQEELRLHLELAADSEARRAGHSPTAAARAARLRVGDVAGSMDAMRDQRGLRWLRDLVYDVRHGWRGIRRTPVFAAVVVLSLALGIGANSALFSLIEATLLRDLPVEAPDELVQFGWRARRWFPRERMTSGGIGTFVRSEAFSNGAFRGMRGQTTTVSEIFGASGWMTPASVVVNRDATRATYQMVTGNFFSTLRVPPAAGRLLTPADDRTDAAPAAVVSHTFWKSRLGLDAGAMGALITIDQVPFTIVGVADEKFRGIRQTATTPDVWVPTAFAANLNPSRARVDFWWLTVMGRMRPGVTLDQVRGEFASVFRNAVIVTDQAQPDDLPELHVWSGRLGAVQPNGSEEQGNAGILAFIFGLLLLFVCLNVVNLLLSRSAARQSEFAVRLSLGAGRGRLVRQLLAESTLLSTLGGLCGLALAFWGKGLFVVGDLVPPGLDLRIDAQVVMATMAAAIVIGLLFGLVPAIRTTRLAARTTRERLVFHAGGTSRLSGSLVVIQVAVSVVLLVGAGLFVRTLHAWTTIDAGFDAEHVLVFQIDPAASGYDDTRAADLRQRLAARMRRVTGVTAASTTGPFWSGAGYAQAIALDGQTAPGGHHDERTARWTMVRDDFFDTVGQRVLAGRGFRAEENARAGLPPIGVINEAFARKFFGRENPVGRRVSWWNHTPGVEVIGVVNDMWIAQANAGERQPTLYLPEHVRPADLRGRTTSEVYRETDVRTIAIRTTGDPLSLLPAVRAAAAEIDPNLPLIEPQSAREGIDQRLAPTRVTSLIWLSFGVVALVLTAVGLYGLLACSVARRTREIGIRAALGARRGQIARHVTGVTALLVVVGLLIGVGASLAVNQLVRAYIFGVTFYDPATLGFVVALIMATAAAAAFTPVRRALSVDPTVALRAE